MPSAAFHTSSSIRSRAQRAQNANLLVRIVRGTTQGRYGRLVVLEPEEVSVKRAGLGEGIPREAPDQHLP